MRIRGSCSFVEGEDSGSVHTSKSGLDGEPKRCSDWEGGLS